YCHERFAGRAFHQLGDGDKDAILGGLEKGEIELNGTDDLRAFLATVPAVHNNVVANQLPFPFDIRAGMWAWKLLYFRPERFQPSPNKSPEWNRGAYLVEGLAHCGACHTPKSFLGGDKTERALQASPVQGWFAPNITNDDRQGLG